MSPTSININLLEGQAGVLARKIEALQGISCGPLRVEAKYSTAGIAEVCFLRERTLLEAVHEEIGDFLGFQTKADAVASAQIAVERHLRHKLHDIAASRDSNGSPGRGEALRLLLHARIAGKHQGKAVEKAPLEQPGPLLTHWEDKRYLGTVLNGLSVGMRDASSIIADAAIVPAAMTEGKKTGADADDAAVNSQPSQETGYAHQKWRAVYTLQPGRISYDQPCDDQAKKAERQKKFKEIYAAALDGVYEKARTIVLAPLPDYSRLHINGMLDAIKDRMAAVKEQGKPPIHIMVTAEDPYLYPIIRECLSARNGELNAAIPLAEQAFSMRNATGVRISDIRWDQWDEVMLMLKQLVARSSKPLRISSESSGHGSAVYLHERSRDEYREERSMSPEALEARKKEVCAALDALFLPILNTALRHLIANADAEPSNGDDVERSCSKVVKGALTEERFDFPPSVRLRSADLPIFQIGIDTAKGQFLALQLVLDDLKCKVGTGKKVTNEQVRKRTEQLEEFLEEEIKRLRNLGSQDNQLIKVSEKNGDGPTLGAAKDSGASEKSVLFEEEDEDSLQGKGPNATPQCPQQRRKQEQGEDVEKGDILSAFDS